MSATDQVLTHLRTLAHERYIADLKSALDMATAEIERLRAMNEGLINARAAAAEVLGRVANKLPVKCCDCLEALAKMEISK